MTANLSDFVLDFCRALGGVVEPPAYNVYDVLLPDAVAAQLGIEPFQHFTFEENATGEGLTQLSYGHPLIERLIELARATPSCAQFYLNDVRLDKTGVAALARAAFTFPNATLVEVPRAVESRAMFHYARFNFKAALIADEKREHILSILMNVQTGAVTEDFSTTETYRLAESPAFTDLPIAAALWTTNVNPLATEPLQTLLDRASHAAADSLSTSITALQARTARHLELDLARLESYYTDIEKDIERRLKRADDESRRANLDSKLLAARADHAAKRADVEAKYRLRVELDLVNLALIAQPKLTLSMQIENRQANVIRPIVWDPLRRAVEPLACDVCFQPATKLFLCANNHLVCGNCLAPQCVDCKRVYCRSCESELMTCVVCDRPVCKKSLTHCRECDRGTCREHATLCHADKGQPRKVSADGSPVVALVSSSPSIAATPPPRVASAPAPKKPAPKKVAPPPSVQPRDPGYRLDVQVETLTPLVVAYILAKGNREVAQRQWELTEEGIAVQCLCEKGWQCPSSGMMLLPESANRIESQLEAEFAKLRAEYHIPSHRSSILTIQGNNLTRLPNLRLRGRWKDEAALNTARANFLAEEKEKAENEKLINYPNWVRTLTPEEAERYIPDIQRFVHIVYGWLWYEGALKMDELLTLTLSVFQPTQWYSPERARTIFKADPSFRVHVGNIISIEAVNHPLKVLKEKEERHLPPRAFTVDELAAVAAGAFPLTRREEEIEGELNQQASRKVSLRSLQQMMRDTDRPSEITGIVIDLCQPRDINEANHFAQLLTEVWNNTFRYELRGRTPNEVQGGEQNRADV